MKECITEYNELMELYERGGKVSYLFMLFGNAEEGLFQHLPLFCGHFGVQLYGIDEKVCLDKGKKAPMLVAVRIEDKRTEQLEKLLGQLE